MPLVWMINQFANIPDFAGHTRQYEIAKSLIKNGWEVELFASDYNLSERKFKKLRKYQLIKTENIKGIKWNWLRVSSYKKNNFKRIVNMLTFCLHLIIIFLVKIISSKKRVNIIIASSPQLPASFLSLIFAKFLRVPFIFEVRDLWPQVLIDQPGIKKNKFLIFCLKLIEKITYKFSDHIIVLSKDSIDYIKERGGKKISWLPNGPDLKLFQFSELPEENNGFNFQRPFTIIYTGAHGESNDLFTVLEAAKLIKEFPIKFIFIGDGPDKNRLMELSRNQKNITFLDPIPKKDIPNFIKNADSILVTLKNIPVFRYGISPNKLYDAYAIGRPVITNIPGSINNEVLKNNLGVTCVSENPNELSNAILKLFYLPRKDRLNMGKRARELAETIYSRDIINKKFNIVLKSNYF